MDNAKKTPVSRLYGAKDGKPFTSENQPSPEAKKAGWEELRKRRLLTQSLLKMLMDENGIPTKEGEDYFKSLLFNAKEGNAKAIDTINNALEDQVQKVETTVTMPTTIEL